MVILLVRYMLHRQLCCTVRSFLSSIESDTEAGMCMGHASMK